MKKLQREGANKAANLECLIIVLIIECLIYSAPELIMLASSTLCVPEGEDVDGDAGTGDEIGDQANGLDGKNSDGSSSSEESEWEEVDGDADVHAEVSDEKIEADSDSDSERLSSGASAGTCTEYDNVASFASCACFLFIFYSNSGEKRL